MALTVPSGFHVYMVANNVPGARFMAFAPNGDLLVSETGAGRVVAIKPGASVSAAPTVVASGLNTPHGLAFHGNDLFIAVYAGLDVIHNYPASTSVQTLYSGLPSNGDHTHHSLAIAPDGTVFESSGSDCNLCTESDSKLATIMHMNADGSNPTIYATGVRNGSGLAFDGAGQLWMVVNQRDDLPPDHTNLPTDEFDKVSAGGNYGWPICYPDLTGTRQPNPDYAPLAPNCSGQIKNAQPLQAHSAPLGIVFYNATLFPAAYQGGAFVAFHGSWDRSPPTGYKIVYVSFSAGNPTGVADFVSGWLLGSSVSGRPVGLAVAPDGELYISDDSNGFIYRVTYG
jgi:glucose/arabinose dehydrogenase